MMRLRKRKVTNLSRIIRAEQKGDKNCEIGDKKLRERERERMNCTC